MSDCRAALDVIIFTTRSVARALDFIIEYHIISSLFNFVVDNSAAARFRAAPRVRAMAPRRFILRAFFFFFYGPRPLLLVIRGNHCCVIRRPDDDGHTAISFRFFII